MKRMMALAWVTLLAAGPLYAQEETPPADAAAAPADAAAAPADAAPAADASAAPADASSGSTDSSASTDSSSGSTDSSASTDSSSSGSDASASADSSSSSEASSESSGSAEAGTSSFPPLYVGVEWDNTKIEINNTDRQAKFGGARRYQSDFYKLRVGARVFEMVGLELQGGIPGRSGDVDNRDLKTKAFYGAYIVPTGVAFNVVEISARLGYSYAKYGAGGASQSVDGVSYGLALELPIRDLGESLPNIRLTSGGTVYQQDHKMKSYGWQVGVRYDFTL